MKTSKSIINHMKETPIFSKLKEQDILRKLLDILPIKLKSGIKFLYIRNNILFFVLTNRIYLMEFKLQTPHLKLAIKNMRKYTDINLQIDEIKFFATDRVENKIIEKETYISYNELANGNFENLATDSDIKTIFEEIRKAICSNRK
jgi:hypothetical protein